MLNSAVIMSFQANFFNINSINYIWNGKDFIAFAATIWNAFVNMQ